LFAIKPNIKRFTDGHWWLALVILATQEVEIRRIVVQIHPGQIVHETISRKNPPPKNERLV
jgi:hypothetical protein